MISSSLCKFGQTSLSKRNEMRLRRNKGTSHIDTKVRLFALPIAGAHHSPRLLVFMLSFVGQGYRRSRALPIFGCRFLPWC